MSCNVNWKLLARSKPSDARMQKLDAQGKAWWCLKCPKCAFAYTLFAAFQPHDVLEKIFGGNCFDVPELQKTYRELLGLEGFKPFECVGTSDEVRAAFLLAHTRGDLEETLAMQLFIKEVLPTIKNPEVLVAQELATGNDHAIPKEFQGVLPKN
jgi:hypothetical protein